MHVTSVDNQQSFKNLRTNFVTHSDCKKLIQKELPALLALGKRYDIFMQSRFDRMQGVEFLTASAFDKALRPWGKNTLMESNNYSNRKTATEYMCDSVALFVKKIIDSFEKG